MSLKVVKKPSRRNVKEFYRALDVFRLDLAFSDYGDTPHGQVLKSYLSVLAYELEKHFPYLDSKNA